MSAVEEPLLCEFCEEPCTDSAADPYIVGLDGRAAHHYCLSKWRDNNPVPEEDV